MYGPSTGYCPVTDLNVEVIVSDLINKMAAQGPLQKIMYDRATENGWRNHYFQTLCNTFVEVYNYYCSTGQLQIDEVIVEAANDVLWCSIANSATIYPHVANQLTQDYVAKINQWLAFSAQLTVKLDDYNNMQRGGFSGGGIRSPRNLDGGSRNYSQAPAPSAGRVHDTWAAGNTISAAPSDFRHPAADFSSRGSQVGGFRTMAPTTPTSSGNSTLFSAAPMSREQGVGGAKSGRFKNNSATSRQLAAQRDEAFQREQDELKNIWPDQKPHPAFSTPADITPPTDHTYRFEEIKEPENKRDTWRAQNSNNTTQQFNPTKHAPVGRDVAEQHEAAVDAAGSWDEVDWANDETGFLVEETPGIKPNHSATPQFMSRISSAHGHLEFTKTTEDGVVEYDYSDWLEGKKDPDFPWEIAYRPGTHTRRIAFDKKKGYFVMIIEENTVRYEDHAILVQSEAVRNNQASKKRHADGASRELFNADSTPVVSLNSIVENKSKVIDNRINKAKQAWQVQEAEAADHAAQTGNAYVAPEQDPSREVAMTTPLETETPEDQLVAAGIFASDSILTIGDLTSGYLNESHAIYSAMAKVAEHAGDFNSNSAIEIKYMELTPYLIPTNETDIKELLAPLTASTNITKLNEQVKYFAGLVGQIPDDLWSIIDDQATDYVNGILATELGTGLHISSYAEDMNDLIPTLRDQYGEKIIEAIGRNIKEFITNLCPIVQPDMSDDEFELLTANILGNFNEDVARRSVLIRRNISLTKVNNTSVELGVFSDSERFVVSETSAPRLSGILKDILERTGDKVAFYKRVLITSDNVRFTIHKGWLGDGSVVILQK